MNITSKKLTPNVVINLFFICIFTLLNSNTFAASQLINGAGASFPYPLYSMWFKTYSTKLPDVKINYQSIGSGGGVRQVIAGTVDFGASDAPMKDEELKEAKSKIYHIPTVLGAVAITYNLPNFKEELKLTPELIYEIYAGNIKKWNDPKLVALNPSLSQVTNYVIPMRRSDGSGTTAVFTEYLAKASPLWKSKFGAGKAIKWGSAMGGKGNEGVTGLVKQNPGALGYIEVTYAHTAKLPTVSIKNKSGNFIKPNLESISLAAQGVSIPEDFRVSITDSANPQSYPISAFTYLLVPESMDKNKSEVFRTFLKWSMSEGQKLAAGLHYANLPPTLVSRVNQKVDQIKFTTK
jgi:phosphate transport system substrate-binding protein